MAVSVSATPVYCDSDDVARILQKESPFFTTSTPSSTDVNEFIVESQDEIDQRTNNAWRPTFVTDEFYDIPLDYSPEFYGYNSGTGIRIFLRKRNIKTANPNVGDKLEVWNGSDYDDWLSDKTEGRANDFWFDYNQGDLFMRYYWAYFRRKALRLSYRFGEETVPADIRKAAALMTAIKILQNDDRSMVLNETGDPTRLGYDVRISQWKKEIDRILTNRTEFIVI